MAKVVPPSDVMTAAEAAALLRVSESTAKRLATRGEVPAVKVGRAWRFNRAQLHAYLRGEWKPSKGSEC